MIILLNNNVLEVTEISRDSDTVLIIDNNTRETHFVPINMIDTQGKTFNEIMNTKRTLN